MDWDAGLLFGSLVLVVGAVVLIGSALPDRRGEGEEAEEERAFLSGLRTGTGPVLGVVYSEDQFSFLFGARPSPSWLWWRPSILRLIVIERHHRPQDDVVIFRARENPISPFRVDHLQEDHIAGFAAWIKAAETHSVPAVYRIRTFASRQPRLVQCCLRAWGKQQGRQQAEAGLYVLPPEQISLMRKEPSIYLAWFNRHICTGLPLPRSSAELLHGGPGR